MNWIIDRIENNTAVCEAGDIMVNVPLSVLPEGASEGDVITLFIDKTQTAERKNKINNLMNSLFK
ncbi:MAG: DUF3006 domain-containing protein [Eubacterium sp.]|nr:DUF3006 domain-containing protein [Eubacterium sp.]